MVTSFDKLGLSFNLIEGLKKQDILEPTDIQREVIPLALKNKDIVGQSQTGSGKTLAYLLPIFEKVDSSKREMQAIILAPTHELVMQINKEINLLAEKSEYPTTSVAIIGDVNIQRQIEKLREKPHIIVGSSGRVLELIKKKKISAHTIKTIVIDEGDRLLDPNNLSIVKDIIKTTMRDRQLMVFSATINEKTLNIAKELMKEPEVIKIEERITVNENIDHMYFEVEQRDKIEMLRKLLASTKTKKAIAFLNKSDEIQITVSKLQYHKVKAYGLFGTATKEERKKALNDFINGKVEVLVCSDIAARGLDVKEITHIFNLDLPPDGKDYLHRVGRTGRAGKAGTAISLVTKTEAALIKKYERDFSIVIEEKDLYKGIIVKKGTRKNELSKNTFKKNTFKKNKNTK